MSLVSFSHGLRIHSPQAAVRIVSIPARQQGKTLAMKLGEAIRKGVMKSAWDGIDDPFGPEADNITPQEDHWRRERERAEASLRQDELMARLAAEREARAFEELEDLEGYGSF